MFRGKEIRENNRGFTLLELVVTVVILALVTAPFLSSFVSASRTNVKSKKIEETNELGALIMEQFKGSTIANMVSTYGLTQNSTYVIDSTNEDFLKKTSSYSVSRKSMSGILDNFSKYYVDIDMVPVQTMVNSDDALPEIDKLDRTKCVVLVENLTKFDVSTTNKRRIIVKTYYSRANLKFIVEVNVATLNSAGTQVSGRIMKWEYTEIPSVYMLYTPKQTGDEIQINNYISSSDYSDFNSRNTLGKSFDEDADKVNVYIINQKDYSDPSHPYYINYDGSKVSIKEGEALEGTITHTSLNTNLKALFTRGTGGKDDSSILQHTVLYSNIWETTFTDRTQISDKQDTVNGPVKLKKLETIYNLDLTVYYENEEISSFHTSKTLGK